jgi:hypothetical protein
VPSRDQVAVPAQHRLGADQQPDFMEYVAGELVEQGGEPGPICPGESDSLAVQVPFEDGDLVPEREDLGVFGAVGHG